VPELKPLNAEFAKATPRTRRNFSAFFVGFFFAAFAIKDSAFCLRQVLQIEQFTARIRMSKKGYFCGKI
jgi:hypothetical protein